jgi:hypothetical protein
VKRAAECFGKQPESNVWILNENTHLNEDGEIIPAAESEYIWIGGMIGNRRLPNVAPAQDAAFVYEDIT